MRKAVCLFAIIIAIISCKEEKKTTKKNKIASREISIIFPDTVYINIGYDGKINYKNVLDTITTSLDNVKKARFIEYAFLKTKTINYNDEYLKKITTDTFVTRNNRLIPLYNIQFDKLGVNYIDGIITDEVMIENGAKSKNGKPMTRIITHETRLTKRVIVIDKHQKKGMRIEKAKRT